MLKVPEAEVARLAEQYPGILDAIDAAERAVVPPCPSCGAKDGARVHVGIVGRSLALARATTKVKLLGTGPAPGAYFCNACQRYYGQVADAE